MDRMKIVIIDDNESFRTVLHYYFLKNKTYEVIALLTHSDVANNHNILQRARIAIVAVKNTEPKTLEAVQFLIDKYSLKILALALPLRSALVDALKGLKVQGFLSKRCIEKDTLFEALDQISKGGSYYKLSA